MDDIAKIEKPTAPFAFVEKIDKRFGSKEVLSGVSFSVHRGEVLGLIGPNGSGKTTLLECLVGLLPTNGGVVRYEGQILTSGRRRSAMYYVPDAIVPYPEHRVANLVGLYRSVYNSINDGITGSDALELGAVLDHRVGELSKGWRRRLLLALGLLTPHPMLLIDEPFDGLDLRQSRDVMNVLRSAAAAGRTLVLSIHQLSEAERICDRFVLLAAGKVAGEGTLTELRAQAGVVDGTLEDIFLALS